MGVVSMVFIDTRAEQNQAVSTVAGHRADIGHVFFRQPFALEQAVEGAAQIQCGIGQGAIQIK